jgi:hypothetical protein
MTKEKGIQWDGKSRISNDTYRQRWDEIFSKPKKLKNVITEDQWVKKIKKEKHGTT